MDRAGTMQAARIALLLSLTLVLIVFVTHVSHPLEVSIEVAGGTLHGTLLEPAHSTTVGVALIISGSGPTDRDTNSRGLRNDALKLLAEGLLAHGIGSLRYDKRGVGASASAMADEREMVIETYVDDAKEWHDFLAAKSNLGARFIIGHSEGALIGILAAQDSDVSAFVSLAGLGSQPIDVLRRQLDDAPLTSVVRDEALSILDTIASGKEVDPVRPELRPLFRPSVQPYLRSWFRYDPAAELAKLAAPALIVQGTTDIQIGFADAQRLANASAMAQLKIIDGMNHVLKIAPRSRAENIAAYNNPDLPLVDGIQHMVPIRSRIPVARQEEARRRCLCIVEGFRRTEGPGYATHRAACRMAPAYHMLDFIH